MADLERAENSGDNMRRMESQNIKAAGCRKSSIFRMHQRLGGVQKNNQRLKPTMKDLEEIRELSLP